MITVLLEKIITILEGWIQSFTSHAQHVEDKLDSLDQTASDIETNTEPISDIKDNTGAVITPIQNIKTNTDSIKQSSQTSANNTTAILNNVSTLSTNTGRTAAFAEDCANNTLDIKDKVTTIASDTTQLRADTAELNDMSDKIYEAIKWSLADKYIDETESGPSPLSFNTDKAAALNDLILDIHFTQSGTGTPSPYNKRPITGLSTLNLNVNGNNNSISLGTTSYVSSLNVKTGVFKDTGYLWILDNTVQCTVSSQSDDVVVFAAPLPNNHIPTPLDNIFTSNEFSIDIPGGNAGRAVLQTSHLYFVIAKSELQSYDQAGARLWLNDNPAQFVFKVAPTESTLSSMPSISAIEGNNIITCDCNDDITVTYTESIKHYLDKQDN